MNRADNARTTMRPVDAPTLRLAIIAPLISNEYNEHAAKLEAAVCEFVRRSGVVDMKMLYHLSKLCEEAEKLLFEDDPRAAELAYSAQGYVRSLMAAINMAQVV